MSDPKYNQAHFKFETIPQRLKKEILDEYNSLKTKKKKTDNDKMFITMVRSKMKAAKMKLVCTHLPTLVKKSWILDSTEFDSNTYMKNLIEVVRSTRDTQKKQLQTVEKAFDGAPYVTCGGVMMASNQINQIGKLTTVNDPMKPKSPRKPKSDYIGVELEFNSNLNNYGQIEIAKLLADAGLSRYVCVGADGSCGWEVRVLLEESNWIEPLTKITQILKDKGFTTDQRCGTHVHFDMRNRDVKKCFKNLYSNQLFLRKFINKDRKKNSFCRKNEIDNFDEASKSNDRYRGINANSYKKYKTIEIRMHQGTLDSSKLIPWIKLLLKIVNFNGELNKKVLTLKQANQNYQLEPDLMQELQARLINRGA